MNKILRKLMFMCFAFMLVFSSCSKKDADDETKKEDENAVEKTADDETKVNNEGYTADSTAVQFGDVEGVIYVNKAALYTETDEGRMKWAAEASLGDVAMYLGEKKEAKRTDGKKRNFYHIALNDKEYWVQDYCYEPNTVAAFITGENTVLYKSESLTAVTDEIIPQYFIVAVYKDSLESSNKKFVKIATYCPELVYSWIVKDKFVKRELVELDSSSVEAMLLAQVAMESNNETIREELFANAIEMSSKYKLEIKELQNLASVMDEEKNFLKKLETEKDNSKFTIKQDVVLLSIPNEENGRVLSSVKAETLLVASKKAVITDADGTEFTWYYVQNKQKKGWVQASLVETE